MAKRGIFSKHIVLTEFQDKRPQYPLCGLILIESGFITDVVLFEKSTPFSLILENYSEWNPLDYSDFYISPGLIDLNTRLEHESYENLTKESLKGGVTLIVTEPGYYSGPKPLLNLYCDICQVQVVDDCTDLESIAKEFYVFKAYLFPPALNFKSVANLQHLIECAQKNAATLFIDPSMPDPRMLYIASPLRLESVEDRSKAEISSSGSTVFAAAFPESMNSDSGESDENKTPSSDSESSCEGELPLKSTSLQANEIKNIFQHHRSISDEKKQAGVRINPEIVISEERHELEVTPKANVESRGRRGSHDIYQDLDNRIKASQKSIEDLCMAERSTYSLAGNTSFLMSFDAPKKSASLSSMSIPVEINESIKVGMPPLEPPNLEKSQKPPTGRRPIRPSPIQIKTTVKPDVLKDYNYFLANYPEYWEVSGIEKVLEYVQSSSKIHFSSLSSAAAINRVRQLRKKCKSVTCEIGASHLCFTSASVGVGDTRFKTTPPIRNQGNCNLLWDLLKMKGIDCICSQHAAIVPNQKLLGNFQQALNGISAAGLSLQAVWYMLNIPVSSTQQLEHYIVRLSKWLSLYPAKVLNLDHIRGKIEKNRMADLVIWDPNIRYIIQQDYGYLETSPFMNRELMGHIHKVYIRGELVYDGSFSSPVGRVVTR